METARRVIWAVIALSLVWALILLATGGFSVSLGSFRVSSRNPNLAIGIVLVAGVALLVVSAGCGGLSTLVADLQRFNRRLATWRARWLPDARVPILVAILILATLSLALRRGAFIAGGSDSYGYVSQADVWLHGQLTMPQHDLPDVQWPFAREVFAPLGYVPDAAGRSLIPIYSPGLPMAMAALARVFGRSAVFWAVPLLGGLCIGATYVLGRQMGGPGTGVMASLLTATHPIFVFQLMTPMSDLAAAAWWTVSLALAAGVTARSQIGAGLAAGAGILTRPNLLPLVLAPMISIGTRRAGFRLRARGLLWFAAGLVPACAMVAFINYRLHGSPLISGYGRITDLYSLTNAAGNLRDYGLKLLRAQPAIVLVAGVGWLISRRASREPTSTPVVMGSLVLIGVTLLSYLFYSRFEEWWSIRFLLPAIPAAMAIVSAVIFTLARRLLPSVQLVVMVVCVLTAAAYGLGYARKADAFDLRRGVEQYEAMGLYVREHLPERAVVMAMMHSGSVRYYSNRLSLRYDLLPPDALDRVLGDLWAQDRFPCALLDGWEVDVFRERFAQRSRFGALDWAPVATYPNGTKLFCFAKGG